MAAPLPSPRSSAATDRMDAILSPLHTTSTGSNATVKGSAIPLSREATAGAFPFPQVEAFNESQTPGFHNPFTGLSPTVTPLHMKSTKAKVAEEFKASAYIQQAARADFIPPRVAMPLTGRPNLFADALAITSELSAEGTWNQTSRILRDGFQASQAVLTMPSDRTDIDNMPWFQVATFNAEEDTKPRASESQNSLQSVLEDREATIADLKGLNISSQRPVLKNRQTYHGPSDKFPKSTSFSPDTPLNISRRPVPIRTTSQASIQGQERRVLDKNATFSAETFQQYERDSAHSETTFASSNSLHSRVLTIPQPLESEFCTLVTSNVITDVLSRGRLHVRSRIYKDAVNLPGSLNQNSRINDAKSRKAPPRSRSETSGSAKSSSTNRTDDAELDQHFEEYEQKERSNSSLSAYLSPTSGEETSINPFFLKEVTRENMKSDDRAFSVVHVPLIHPNAAISQTAKSLRLKEDKKAKNRSSSSLARLQSSHTSTSESAKRAPLAILSMLVPFVPFPDHLEEYAEGLAPFLATSIYNVWQKYDDQRIVGGRSRGLTREMSSTSASTLRSMLGFELLAQNPASPTSTSSAASVSGSSQTSFNNSKDLPGRRSATVTPGWNIQDGFGKIEGEGAANADNYFSYRPSTQQISDKTGKENSQAPQLEQKVKATHAKSDSKASQPDMALQSRQDDSNANLPGTFYENMVENGVPQFVVDTAIGTIIWSNHKYQIYRSAVPAQIRAHPWKHIHKHDKKKFNAAWEKAQDTKEKLSEQLRLLKYDGRYRWHHVRISPMILDGRHYWHGIELDIHDQHEAEVEAREARSKTATELKYRAIANAQPGILFAASEAKGVTFANSQWLTYSGRSLEASLGFGFLEAVYPEDVAKFRFLELRTQTEANLLSQDTLSRRPLARIKSDASSGGDSVATKASEATVKPEADSEEPTFTSDILEQLKRDRAITTEDVDGNLTVTAELRLRSKFGKWRWFLVKGARSEVSDISRESAEWFITATDIDSQKNTEFDIQKFADQKVDRNMDYLVSMSHELRTPLNTINGNLELVMATKMKDQAQLSSVQLELIGGALESASGMKDLVNDILDLSKLENSTLKLRYTNFNPRETVDKVFGMLKNKAFEKELEMSHEVRPDVPLEVRGDEDRIRRVLVNLVGNSVKFTKSGEIWITCELVKELPSDYPAESLKAHQCLIRWTVHDTGPGFTENEAKSLFKPYSQIHNRETRDVSGTGLGLTICKSMVELHGGAISATANPGKGAIFSFYAKFSAPRPTKEFEEKAAKPTLRRSATSDLAKALSAKATPLAASSTELPQLSRSESQPIEEAIPKSPTRIEQSLVRPIMSPSASQIVDTPVSIVANRKRTLLTPPLDTAPGQVEPPRSMTQPLPEVVSSNFKPEKYSILLICPQSNALRIMKDQIERVIPPSIPSQITIEKDVHAAYEILDENLTYFTHVVLRIAKNEDMQSFVTQLISSDTHPDTYTVLLVDDEQMSFLNEANPELKFQLLADIGRAQVLRKPTEIQSFARVFDPDNERGMQGETAAEMKKRLELETRQEAISRFKDVLGQRKLRMLVVEDDPTQRLVAKRLLQQWCEIEVTTAINGVLGLSTYTSSPHGHFAAVLSDAEMPVLDGFGMCTQLRAWEAANNIAHPVPVVLLSAHSANVSWERAAQAGFTQLHGKPIDMLRLGDVLIEVTDPEGEQVLLRDRPLPRSMVVEEDDDSD